MQFGKSRHRRTDRTDRRCSAFTLIELLVVVAIIAVLLGILLPVLSSARAEGTKAKCLANLHSIAQGFLAYSVDDLVGYTAPVHAGAETYWCGEGEYEYGGQTGVGVYGIGGWGGALSWEDFRAENRPLNRYLFGSGTSIPWDLFQCPTETGIPAAPYDFDDYFFSPEALGLKVYEVTGTSYRLNNHFDFTGQTAFDDHFYGPYLRPTTHVPDPSSTIILAEAISEVAKWNEPTYRTMGWHRKLNTFNVAFVDGHVGSVFIAGQTDWAAASAEKDYWLLRGDGWRMDCYPRAAVCDRPDGCGACE